MFGFSLSAQITNCGQSYVTEQILKKYPELKRNTNLNKYPLNLNTNSAVNYTIPVVFHILHTGGSECISDAQINSQMAILNRDFQKLNADTLLVAPSFSNNIAKVGIAFKLASIDPNGNCTNGIIRHYDSNTIWDPFDLSLFIYSWPSDQYLNIYIVKSIIGINGAYTFLPSGSSIPPQCDAIVCMHNFVGNTGTTLGVDYRVLTHEIGHWFDLEHTWGSTNNPMVACGDDGVADTPITKGFVSCALNNAAICNPSVQENVQNYMDYAPCKLMFTNGQKSRMLSCLTSNLNNRQNLYSASNLAQTGVTTSTTNCIPKIDVATTTPSVCAGRTITINSYSSNANPTSYSWTISGPAVASTFTNSFITITTTAVGSISLSCIASNSNGSSASGIVLSALNSSVSAPGAYAESFEGNGLPVNWLTYSTNTPSVLWATTGLASSSGSKSIYINGSQTSAGAIQILETPSYDLNANQGASYTFKYAYARKSPSHVDFLSIQGSKDCGNSWQTIYSTTSGFLSSGSGGTSSTPFFPNTSQWKIYDLSAHPNYNNFINESNVKFRFIFRADTLTGQSNNFFLDEINLNSTVGLNELINQTYLQISPNPFQNNLSINISTPSNTSVQIFLSDLLGKNVQTFSNHELQAGKNEIRLDKIDKLEPGIYFITIVNDQYSISKKIIKQ